LSQKKRLVSSQKLVGMQVIDVKGIMVGSVRDVGVDLTDKRLVLYVTTKAKTELEIPWESIQSIEDVVLLNKQVEVPAVSAPSPAVVAPPTTIVCPNCKSVLPARAKFCAKCGSKLGS